MTRRIAVLAAYICGWLLLIYLAAIWAPPAQAYPMWVSCYGDCGTGYNPLYGNATCADPEAFFTGEDYTMAGEPTFNPGSLVQITNLDNGYSVQVLVNDCHYGYTRPDISSAAFGAIAPYAQGVAWVEATVVRDGWDGMGNYCTDRYGTWWC